MDDDIDEDTQTAYEIMQAAQKAVEFEEKMASKTEEKD